MMKIKGTDAGSGASPRARLREYSVLCVVVLLSLIIAGCAPTLKRMELPKELVEAEREKQRELAFSILMKRWGRLLRLSYPLRVAAADFCENAVKPTYGFALHDRKMYKGLGKEYEEVAARYFGLAEGVYMRYVHPELPAGKAGLMIGDNVLTIEEKSLKDKSARHAIKLIEDLELEEGDLLELKIERDGQTMDFSIQGVPGCNYPVLIAREDMVNAFADGRRVIITTGMVRFTESDDELVLVIGHEIAHNALGHLDKRTGNVFLGTLFDILVAITTGVSTQGLFGQIGGMAFSQSFEAEADYAGLYIAARAGFDIKEAANFWRRMAIEHPGSIKKNFGATHPGTAERFLALEKAVQEIEEKKQKGEPLLPEKKFQEEKKSKAQEDE